MQTKFIISDPSSQWYTGATIGVTNNCTTPIDLVNALISFKSNSNAVSTVWTWPFTSSTATYQNSVASFTLLNQGNQDSSTKLQVGSTLNLNFGVNLSGKPFNLVDAQSSLQLIPNAAPPTPTNGEIDVQVNPAGVKGISTPAAIHVVSGMAYNKTISNSNWTTPSTYKLTGLAYGTYTLSADALTGYNALVQPVTVVVNSATPQVAAVTYQAQAKVGSINVVLPTAPLQKIAGNTSITLTDTTTQQVYTQTSNWNTTTSFGSLPAGDSYLVTVPTVSNGQQLATPNAVPALKTSANQTSTASVSYQVKTQATTPVSFNVSGLSGGNGNLSLTDSYGNAYNFANVNNGIVTQQLPINNAYTVSASATGLAATVTPAQFNTPLSSTVQVKFAVSSASVRGWPSYIAMGSVTNDSDLATFQARQVDAIFKYEGDNGGGDLGQLMFPWAGYETAVEAGQLSSSAHLVRPVMVNYTAQESGGATTFDFESNNLALHFVNLAMEAGMMQSFKTSANPYPGSVVMNPDFLGMLQQNPALPDMINQTLQANAISVNQATKIAACFVTTTINYNNQTQPQNYLQIFNAMIPGHGVWDAAHSFNTGPGQTIYAKCAANPVVPSSIQIPAFSNDLKGWVAATNWTMKTFGPDVTFGWQENLWATGSANWVHTRFSGNQLQTQQVQPVVNVINNLQMYSGPYKPDFIVFDRYERDDFADAVWSMGYLYNAADWTNLLAFAKGVSVGLGNSPVMLWQIPGGHLQQQTGDVDTRGSGNPHAATAPDYFFGDTYNPLTNLRTYIKEVTLPTSIYPTTSVATYLSQNESGVGSAYTWQTGHMAQAAAANVFSILWGGGNTTGIGATPSDDGGWLSNKVNAYYQNPTPVQ